MWLNILATIPTRTLADTLLSRFPVSSFRKMGYRVCTFPRNGKTLTVEATFGVGPHGHATDIRSKFCCGRLTGGLISELRHRLGLKAEGSEEPPPVAPSRVATPKIPQGLNRENLKARKSGFVNSGYPYFPIARNTGWVISVGLLVSATVAAAPLRGRGRPPNVCRG